MRAKFCHVAIILLGKRELVALLLCIVAFCVLCPVVGL